MRKILTIFLMMICMTQAHAVSLINDTETEQFLTELIAPIAGAANIPKNRLKIYIVNDNDFNAFVRGGEDVFIYTGLLTQIKTPDALQAVVAHELGHTIGGHMAQMSARMDAELKRSMLIQALGVGLMVAGGNPSMGMGVLAGSGGIATQSMLAFSRDEERIADNMGLDLMVRAGANPQGFVEVFEQMNELTGAMESKVNPNRINHPLTRERLKNVREQIAQKKLTYNGNATRDAQRAAKYDLIRAKLIGYLDGTRRVRTIYPEKDTSSPALYARAIASMNDGNLDAARNGTMTLISKSPNNPYFYELLGDIEYQYGHYDDSVTAYEHALSLTDDAPQIQTALALVLTERNKQDDRERAIVLAKASILNTPTPLAYWVMARAYGTDDGRADWAMAEFYKLQNDTKQAKKYARAAQKKLPKSAPEYIKAGDLLE